MLGFRGDTVTRRGLARVREEHGMATAKRGDKVLLHYTGKLANGTIFDSTEDAGEEVYRNFNGRGVAFEPAELVIGAGEMPADFEDALVGMEPGQSKRFVIPAARAFGARQTALVTKIERDELGPRELGIETFRVAEGRQRPNVFNPKVGDVLDMKDVEGKLLQARIVAMDDETVTLDTNHPLAGYDLHVEVRVVEVVQVVERSA
jgi:peptidylprolyl isomerase